MRAEDAPLSAWVVRGPDRADATPGWFFDKNPMLLAYADAYPGAGIPSVSFTYLAGRIWYEVVVRTQDRGVELVATRREPPNGLTPRELDVLTLVACGLANDEIARALYISSTTVRSRMERILGRFELSSRAAAAALAVESRLLRLPLPESALEASPLAVGALERARLHAGSSGSRSVLRPGWQPIIRRSDGRPFRLVSVLSRNADGEERRLGVELATEELNRRGGIRGRFLESLVVNVDVDSSIAVDRVLAEVEARGPDAVNWSAPHDDLDPLELVRQAGRLGRPFLHSIGSDDAVEAVRTSPGLANIFQICPSLHVYARGFAEGVRDARRRGVIRGRDNRLVVIGEDPTRVGSVGAARPGNGSRTASSAPAVDLLTVGPNDDWAEQVQRIRDAPPSGILVSTWNPHSLSRFLDAFFSDPFPSLVHAVWLPGAPEFDRQLEEGVVWSSNIGPYPDAIGVAFQNRFSQTHGRAPWTAAGVQYDVTHLLARAWRDAWHPDSSASVSEALRTGVMRGVNGAYFFGSPGQVALSFPHDTPDGSLGHARFTYQVQQGRHRIVSPTPFAAARIETPWWLDGHNGMLRAVG